MTSAFSWQNSVSFCPASFCTPRPNLENKYIVIGLLLKNEKGTLLHCRWECSYCGEVWRFLQKLKTELSYAPAVPLLGIYAVKSLIWKDTWTPMSVGTYIFHEIRKISNWPSAQWWDGYYSAKYSDNKLMWIYKMHSWYLCCFLI